MKQATMVALLCCSIALGARAATLEGVTMPDTLPVAGQSLVLNGMGLRTLTIFRIRAYVAGLYLAAPNHDAAAILASPGPKAIILQYLHGASKEQVQREYRAGATTNCGQGECDQADAADFERMVAAAPAVEPGDTTIFELTGSGVQVYANSKLIGDYADKDLANRLLAGFIGPKPPSQELKDGMLGLPP
jgi:hypothetical protein